jgi:hypothetical protein
VSKCNRGGIFFGKKGVLVLLLLGWGMGGRFGQVGGGKALLTLLCTERKKERKKENSSRKKARKKERKNTLLMCVLPPDWLFVYTS